MLVFILVGLMNMAVADAPEPVYADATIIVEARKNMVIYVEEPIIVNSSENINSNFNHDSIVGYVNSHAKLGKVKNARGSYEPVTMHTDKIEVYDKKTIKYAYPECSYKRDALWCGVQNNHYTVRTNISINDREVVVRMTLYDSSALIVSTSSRTSKEIVEWIRQQEISTTQNSKDASQQILSGQNCSGGSCNVMTAQQPVTDTNTITKKPKEDLPIRFSIPPKLLDQHIHQASIGLFVGIKLD